MVHSIEVLNIIMKNNNLLATEFLYLCMATEDMDLRFKIYLFPHIKRNDKNIKY